MLKELRISNFALIRELTFCPANSLTIITGETGAGKSIMLGAVGLLLGQRADTKSLYDAKSKCIIEGEFNIEDYNLQDLFKSSDLDYEEICLVRREILPNGKTRAFINDTPVTLDIMQELGSSLVDIHSQHDTLLLRKSDFQLEVLDSYSGSEKLLAEYREIFRNFKIAEKKLVQLEVESAKLAEEFDFFNFQRDELSKANLLEDEQEELENQVKVLENAEEIKLNLNQLMEMLKRSEGGAIIQLKEAVKILRQLSKYSNRYESISDKLESISLDLDELVREIEGEEENVEFDPQRAEEMRNRLGLIYHLQQKHRVSANKELISILEQLEEKVRNANTIEDELGKSRKNKDNLSKQINEKGEQLSEKRKKALASLQKEVSGYLKDLGMPDAVLKIEMKPIEPAMQGKDQVVFLFSANKGIHPKELKQVASGGEFSRLMFCFKFILAQKSHLPTLVFDEIDNGISGEIALKLGNMMKAMAMDHQVVTISHLPQIAAKGNSHFFVYKDNVGGKAASKIRELSQDERVEELAKMIAGEKPTQNAFKSAKELMTG